MAQSQDSKTSSGYESRSGSPISSINPNYRCFWDQSCDGQHELDQCHFWKRELAGKLGIYYSTSSTPKEFSRDEISGKDLEKNPTGCTTVHLLIFNDEKKEILFGLKLLRSNVNKHEYLLQFPTSKPFRRNGPIFQVAYRAFQALTTNTIFSYQCLEQGFQNRFLFQDASIIFPVVLTNEQAEMLKSNFRRNDEFQSLHWFTLKEVLQHIQQQSTRNIKRKKQTENEIRNDAYIFEEISLEDYQLWHVTARCLINIQKYVPEGFDEFLSR